jgi:hypothetical protein
MQRHTRYSREINSISALRAAYWHKNPVAALLLLRL